MAEPVLGAAREQGEAVLQVVPARHTALLPGAQSPPLPAQRGRLPCPFRRAKG